MRYKITPTAMLAILSCLALAGTDCPSGTTVLPENLAPTANAGANAAGIIGVLVSLDASGSTDPESDTLTFLWEQVSGPNVTLSSAAQMIASFTPASHGTYVFKVTVDDGNGGSGAGSKASGMKTASATVEITVPYASATLVHWGFDFSKGVGGSAEAGDVPDSDGATIIFAVWPTTLGAGEVWWDSHSNTATENFSKDMGAVSLESVATVPTTWDAGAGLPLDGLVVGHVYVVKCLDGFAKFLVKTLSALDPGWPVDVEYEFTSGTTFPG